MNNATQDIDINRFPCTAQVLAELEGSEPSDYAPTAPPPAASASVPPLSLANELAMALARGIFGR